MWCILDPVSAPLEQIGRYALWDEIGAGGMASVRLARFQGPVGFSRTVAVKSLHPHISKDAEFVAMLLDEARIATRIRHPNVVQVVDVVVDESRVALVLEYVHGDSLSKLWKAASHNVPRAISLRIVIDMLRGLHAAHEARAEDGLPLGIVHRDVSPQNVLVGFDGLARVLDFGVAKAAGRMQSTDAGHVKGKLAYMSPEQVMGQEVTRRCDVFASGIVLWELIAQKRLYTGDQGELLRKVSTGTVPPLPTSVPYALRAAIERALALDPQERFESAAAMASALELCSPASTDDVARWAARASPTYAARELRLAELERSAARARDPSGVDHAEVTLASTEVVVTPSPAPVVRNRLSRILGALVVASAVVAGVWLAAATRASSSSSAAIVRRDRDPTLARHESPQRSAAASLSAPVRSPHVARLAVASPGKDPKRPAPSCDPPYVMDDQGNKVYNRACLGP